MLRSLVTSFTVVCLLFPAAGRAAEFVWDLAAFANTSHTGPFDTDRWSIEATRYFSGVDDSVGPYSLAPFLDPASSVSVVLDHSRVTDQVTPIVALPPIVAPPIGGLPIGGYVAIGAGSTPIPSSLVSHDDEKSVSGRYLLPRSKWYFGGNYSKTDAYSAFAANNFDYGAAYGVFAGKYLGPRTSLEATVDMSETRSEYTTIVYGPIGFIPPGYNTGTAKATMRRNHTSIGLTHVAGLGALRYALSGRIAATTGHSDLDSPATMFQTSPFGPVISVPASHTTFGIPRLRSYSVAGELFPTTRLGVRVGYTRWDDDTPADQAYDVTTTWFVTRNVAIRFAFLRQRADNPYFFYADPEFQTTDVRTIGVIARF